MSMDFSNFRKLELRVDEPQKADYEVFLKGMKENLNFPKEIVDVTILHPNILGVVGGALLYRKLFFRMKSAEGEEREKIGGQMDDTREEVLRFVKEYFDLLDKGLVQADIDEWLGNTMNE